MSFTTKLLATAAVASVYLHGHMSAQKAAANSRQQSDITASALYGEFVGMEEMKDYQPREKWFHENSLLIKDNEAVLDKVPLEIVKSRKSYSASDGGFITYRGRFFRRDNRLLVSLRPFDSEYIIFPAGGCEPYSRVTIFAVKVASHIITIDGVLYRPPSFSKEKRERLSRMLRNEPMAYTGARPYNPAISALLASNGQC